MLRLRDSRNCSLHLGGTGAENEAAELEVVDGTGPAVAKKLARSTHEDKKRD